LTEDDFNLSAPKGLKDDDINYLWLLEYIYKNNIQVVIIDTFRATAGGLKEDKAEEVRAFFQRFQILKNSGISVIFSEHRRKPNNFEGKVPKKEQLLGSQDKTANMEVLLMISKGEEDGHINVYQRKNRIGVEMKPFTVSIKDTVNDEGKEIMKFEYIGEIDGDSYKKDLAKEAILGLLESVEGLLTNEVLSALKKEGFGSKNVRIALDELVKESLVLKSKMSRQNYYSLPKEEKWLEIEGGPLISPEN